MSTIEPQTTTNEKDPLILTESDVGSESDLDELESDSEAEKNDDHAVDNEPTPDPRFNPPRPSSYKRAALIILTVLLIWFAHTLKTSLLMTKKPKVIYASRYSKEHKFRPAASPIITETLKDGRIRLRGAAPTSTPLPTPTVKRTKGKRKARKAKKAPRKK